MTSNDALPHPIRLLLVDDHAIVRAGYRHLLNRQANLDLLDEADTAEQAYSTERPDIRNAVLQALRLT